MTRFPALRQATLDARKRTGKFLAVSVQQGRYRVEHHHPSKTEWRVEPLTEFLPESEAIKFLNDMEGAA